jgi:hypothetical protein
MQELRDQEAKEIRSSGPKEKVTRCTRHKKLRPSTFNFKQEKFTLTSTEEDLESAITRS